MQLITNIAVVQYALKFVLFKELQKEEELLLLYYKMSVLPIKECMNIIKSNVHYKERLKIS